MNTITFEVPRIKECVIDRLLDILNEQLKHTNITKFHAEKWRFNNTTTIYTICYIEEINE